MYDGGFDARMVRQSSGLSGGRQSRRLLLDNHYWVVLWNTGAKFCFSKPWLLLYGMILRDAANSSLLPSRPPFTIDVAAWLRR